MLAREQFENFFKYYNDLPHQQKGIEELYKQLPSALKEEDNLWIQHYRNQVGVEQKDLLLNLPWYPQTDNFTMPYRTCNTSSCAMALKYFRPKNISDKPNADDEYLRTVMKYGDTTVHEVQTKALRAHGLESEFRFDLDFDDLDRELKAGRPVVIAILHRGPLDNPTGGHIIVCRGIADDGYWFNDPYGSCNNNYSGHVNEGRCVKYTKTMLKYRWLHKGPNTGWGRIFKP